MKTFYIHNPINSNYRHHRDYNLFFDDLTDKLKEKYNIIENRETEKNNIPYTEVFLKSSQKPIFMMECEYIIENAETEEFYILSVADQISHCILSQKENKKLKKVLYSQYVPDQIVHHTQEFAHKYIPWIYFPQNVVDLDYYYNLRQQKKQFISKLFFKGNTEYRPILDNISSQILSDTSKIENDRYFDTIIDYEICLSIGGAANGDICYRDVECLALGIPILRFEFVSTLNPSLIPNYHYISIPIPQDLPIHNGVQKDRLGIGVHGKLIEDKFNEIISNKSFLKFISENSRKYYEDYLSKDNRIYHTLKLLDI
jgi:hypothetical protein